MLSVATDRADRCTTHCPIGQSEALLDLVFSPREPKAGWLGAEGLRKESVGFGQTSDDFLV